MPSASERKVGLIAGQGQLPLLVVDGMRAAGMRICAVGLRDQFDPALPAQCDEFHAAGLARIGRWMRVFRRAGVTRAVMVGRVAKVQMHDPLGVLRHLPDSRAINIWYRRLRFDRRTPAVLAALADELQKGGIALIDSTTYIRDHMAAEGVMGSVTPAPRQRGDVTFGWPLLEQVVCLDIGQAIAVRDRDVIAVEAVEGTDSMIERAGGLCRARGWTLLKTARPDHDRRGDVPTIGVETIERVAAAGCGCVALGVDQVILIDKPAVIAAADRAGVALLGVPDAADEGGAADG